MNLHPFGGPGVRRRDPTRIHRAYPRIGAHRRTAHAPRVGQIAPRRECNTGMHYSLVALVPLSQPQPSSARSTPLATRGAPRAGVLRGAASGPGGRASTPGRRATGHPPRSTGESLRSEQAAAYPERLAAARPVPSNHVRALTPAQNVTIAADKTAALPTTFDQIGGSSSGA